MVLNIGKWVKFVLGESPESLTTSKYEVEHHLVYDPEYFDEKVLDNPSLIYEIASNSQVDNKLFDDISVSYFDNRVVVSIKELSKKEDLFDLSKVEKVTTALSEEGVLLSESPYNRMRQYGIYKFGCLIEYETTSGEARRGLDDIVSDIRAIPTVTIVSVVLANERVSSGRYVAGLQIKFIPSYPGNLTQPEDAKSYILTMIRKIKNVRGISRVTLKTDRIE